MSLDFKCTCPWVVSMEFVEAASRRSLKESLTDGLKRYNLTVLQRSRREAKSGTPMESVDINQRLAKLRVVMPIH